MKQRVSEMSISSYGTLIGETETAEPLVMEDVALRIPGSKDEWIAVLLGGASGDLFSEACRTYYGVTQKWNSDRETFGKENIELAQARRLAFIDVLNNLSHAALALAQSVMVSYSEHIPVIPDRHPADQPGDQGSP